MFCVLRSSGESYSYEWSAGLWKAEVDFYSEDVLLQKAATVKGEWPLTHGKYFSVLRLYDPEDFFTELQKAAESPKMEDFYRAICGVLVGEIYEFVGKWRNISVQGPVTYLPSLVIEVAKYGAMLIGLHNRTYFSTSAQVLSEALNLPNRPRGFDHLCEMVMSGHLGNSKAIINSCENFWKGIMDWAAENGYVINHKEKIPF
jgi:kanamycin nucleotidyltransferase